MEPWFRSVFQWVTDHSVVTSWAVDCIIGMYILGSWENSNIGFWACGVAAIAAWVLTEGSGAECKWKYEMGSGGEP